MDYRLLRNGYYLGLLLLVVYSLQQISFIKSNIVPFLETPVLGGWSFISLLAIFMGFVIFRSWKDRVIG
jgi:hypothetical protein